MSEEIGQFEQRKREHLALALDERHQAIQSGQFDAIVLEHDALPAFNLSEVRLDQSCLGRSLKTPFFVPGMTAGHADAVALNQVLAEACASRGWVLGVGSQRRQLNQKDAVDQWSQLREKNPSLVLLSNLGITQLADASIESIFSLVESLDSQALVVHFNALQEALQPEGTPNFKGSLEALKELSAALKSRGTALVLKETGCGFSEKTLFRLVDQLGDGISAVDVSGLGGTHWGRIEGSRAGHMTQEISETFANWGVSTVASVRNAVSVKKQSGLSFEIWASGGVRTGLDAAKLISIGADRVGFAKPALVAAMQGRQALHQWMEKIEKELQIAAFCSGNITMQQLGGKK
ncbi:MAG: type 2 isopentenyl-diphosphate Delta-isomerase [Bdellovibrionales bacterium]|nr:type 2 isopentenyl-diphosphate Delta-isomerase [Bdellovibrionales bacterium]